MLNFLFLIGVFGTSLSAFAATDTPRAVVETIIEKASKLDQKATKAENARTIESLVDFEKLANDALGKHANQIKAQEKNEIRDLLRKVITKTVYPEAPKFFRDVKIQYTNEEVDNNKTHITSLVTKGNKRSTVEYWLSPSNGTNKVVDLAIEGERWVENVSDQFDEVINKNGASGLIAKMKKRLAQLENKKK